MDDYEENDDNNDSWRKDCKYDNNNNYENKNNDDEDEDDDIRKCNKITQHEVSALSEYNDNVSIGLEIH